MVPPRRSVYLYIYVCLLDTDYISPASTKIPKVGRAHHGDSVPTYWGAEDVSEVSKLGFSFPSKTLDAPNLLTIFFNPQSFFQTPGKTSFNLWNNKFPDVLGYPGPWEVTCGNLQMAVMIFFLRVPWLTIGYTRIQEADDDSSRFVVTRWWQLKYFFFHPYLGRWSNLTSICFKWVGSTTNPVTTVYLNPNLWDPKNPFVKILPSEWSIAIISGSFFFFCGGVSQPQPFLDIKKRSIWRFWCFNRVPLHQGQGQGTFMHRLICSFSMSFSLWFTGSCHGGFITS